MPRAKLCTCTVASLYMLGISLVLVVQGSRVVGLWRMVRGWVLARNKNKSDSGSEVLWFENDVSYMFQRTLTLWKKNRLFFCKKSRAHGVGALERVFINFQPRTKGNPCILKQVCAHEYLSSCVKIMMIITIERLLIMQKEFLLKAKPREEFFMHN